MIKIEYMKSVSGLDNCFDLLFSFDEYFPNIEERFGCTDTWDYQLHTWLFKKNNLFKGSEKGKEYIWSIHWDCEIKGIPFSMVYDEDYDIISFSLDENHLQYRETVAEELKRMIEEESVNYSNDIESDD